MAGLCESGSEPAGCLKAICQAMINENATFLSNIRFSDECHIHLDGYIDKQTTRFFGFEQLDVIVQTPFHSERVTIWCAISAKVVLGPYFVEDDGGHSLTVNQDRYKNLIITAFLRDLRRLCRARNVAYHTQWF
ncbi:hypothetical protein ANN_22078 [Periplaneta americana]|uniref:Uncharacterized protein n=1 Tax=Periplaneta americana TaxID=6978 RepID=A0ABQ8S7M4_PERAM|nr:hypothetical protein ANN_22078 [Periplaneta americana]